MQLVILNGPSRGQSILLESEPVTLGRIPEATLTLDDKKVSRLHAKISPDPDGGGWILRDLDSTNLTFLNSEPVSKAVLKEGDVVRVGNTEVALEVVPQELPLDAQEDPSSLTLEVSQKNIESLLRRPRPDTRTGLSEAIYRISTMISGELSPQDLLHRMLPVVEDRVSFTTWAWIEWNEGLDRTYVVTAEKTPGRFQSGAQLSQSLISRAIRNQRGMVSGEIQCDFETSMAVRPDAVGSAMVIPLPSQRANAQALYLERDVMHPVFSAKELEMVAVLSSVIGPAVDNAHLYRELREAYENLDTYLSQMNKSEKLASIGRLASSFAHDLNNPLSSLMGFLELAQRYVDKEIQDSHREKLCGFLSKVHDAADFCRGLSRNVLSFAREAPHEPIASKPFVVAPTINTTLAICDSSLRRSQAEVKIDVPQTLVLSGDPSALQQIVMNLVTNASDAIRDAEIDGGVIQVNARSEDGLFVLEVTDNGPGIPEKIRERIFEPLFTTKGESRGTGLGLYVISSLVGDAGGRLEVDTEIGQGSTFRVRIPNALQPLGSESVAPVAAESPEVRSTEHSV